MSFLDCIRTAAESGLIKPEKAKAAEAEWQSAFDDAIANGASEDMAHAQAGIAAVETVTKMTGAKKWQKINQIRKSHALYQNIMKMKDLREGAYDIMRRVEDAYDRNRGLAMRHMENVLEAYRPKWGGIVRPIKGQDNIVHEIFGQSTGDQSAKEMAEAISKVVEWTSKRANMEGASIPNNPNWRLPQKRDRLKIRQFSEDEFVSRELNRADWSVIEYNGKTVPVAAREGVLREMYKGIVTDGNNRIDPGQTTGKANVAERLSQSRFFYYRDAESYLASMKDFGAGNVYDQVISMVDSMSRKTALMETFGPSPQAGLNFTKRALERRGADLELARGPTRAKSHNKIVQETITNLDDQYKILSGFVVGPDENLAMLWLANAQTVVKAPMLSGVLLASVPDLAFVKSSRAVTGLPTVGFMREYAKNFVVGGRGFRKQAIRSGLIAESAINLASGYTKFHGPLEGSRWAQRWADIHYRVGLATHHNQIIKHTYGMEAMGHFADNVAKKFDDLEGSQQLSAFGITPADWDLFRSTPLHEDRGATFLRPVDLINRVEGDVENNVRTGEKFLDFILSSMRQAIPNPDVVTKAGMGAAVSGATLRGQALRMTMSLKSFPVTIMTTQLKNIYRLGGWTGLKAFVKLALTTTLLGSVSMQMKALANGQDLYSYLDPLFWRASLVQGGSLGLAGDLVYNSLRGQGVKAAVQLPMTGFVDDTLKLPYDVGKIVGQKTGLLPESETHLVKDAVAFSARYGPRTWQLKLLLERYFYDTILEAGDPAAYAEKQRKVIQHANDTGQEMWWAPGEQPRTPKVSPPPQR